MYPMIVSPKEIFLEKLLLEDPAAFEHKWYAVFLLLW